MGKPRLRASVVCETEGHLLLVRLRDPKTQTVHFYPPGGGIEPGESPAQTAEREALEETGLRVRVDPSIALVDEYPFTWDGVDYDCTTHYLAAALVDRFDPDVAPVEDADYNEGAAWRPTEEALATLAVHPRIATAVTRVLGRARRAAWRRDPRLSSDAQRLLLAHDQLRAASSRLRAPEVELDEIARRFRPLAEQLLRDHEGLEAAIDDVFAALRSGKNAAAALARFDDVLVDHLDREEARAIPARISAKGHGP